MRTRSAGPARQPQRACILHAQQRAAAPPDRIPSCGTTLSCTSRQHWASTQASWATSTTGRCRAPRPRQRAAITLRRRKRQTQGSGAGSEAPAAAHAPARRKAARRRGSRTATTCSCPAAGLGGHAASAPARYRRLCLPAHGRQACIALLLWAPRRAPSACAATRTRRRPHNDHKTDGQRYMANLPVKLERLHRHSKVNGLQSGQLAALLSHYSVGVQVLQSASGNVTFKCSPRQGMQGYDAHSSLTAALTFNQCSQQAATWLCKQSKARHARAWRARFDHYSFTLQALQSASSNMTFKASKATRAVQGEKEQLKACKRIWGVKCSPGTTEEYDL